MNIEASNAIIRGLKAAGVDMLAILPDHGFDRVQREVALHQIWTTSSTSICLLPTLKRPRRSLS